LLAVVKVFSTLRREESATAYDRLVSGYDGFDRAVEIDRATDTETRDEEWTRPGSFARLLQALQRLLRLG
jgi:hypothetical protein